MYLIQLLVTITKMAIICGINVDIQFTNNFEVPQWDSLPPTLLISYLYMALENIDRTCGPNLHHNYIKTCATRRAVQFQDNFYFICQNDETGNELLKKVEMQFISYQMWYK